VVETVFRAGIAKTLKLKETGKGGRAGTEVKMSCGALNATGEFWRLDDGLGGPIGIGQRTPRQAVGAGVTGVMGMRVVVGLAVGVFLGVEVGVRVAVAVGAGVDVAVAGGGGTFPVTETRCPSAS